MYNANWKTTLCLHCNNPLKNGKQMKYCSPECSNTHKRVGDTVVEVVCKSCEVTFLKKSCEIKKSSNHFCNRSCAATFINTSAAKRKRKQRLCERCTKDITWEHKHILKRSKLCTDCRKETKSNRIVAYKILNRTKEEYTVKGHHVSSANAKIRSHAQTIIRSLGIPKICRRCGYSYHADIAHIIAASTFSEDTLIREINAPTNLIPLCKNCHWEFDHGNIPLNEIVKLNEKMLEEFNYLL